VTYRFGFNGKEKDNEVKGGDGLQQDYGMRIYDSRLGRFLSVDPLSKNFAFYSPYQYAGNKPIRFVDLDGEEEANPSFFTKALNWITGAFEVNRLNDYLTKKELTSDNVVSLANDTYVVFNVVKTASGATKTEYSIFRSSRKNSGKFFNWAGSHNDDIELSEEEFLKSSMIGELVLDAPVGAGPIKAASAVIMGAKNNSFAFRQIVGSVQQAGKELVDWKSKIKFGVLDAIGSSRDLLKKGFHLHFKELKNIELSLQYEKIGDKGRVVLGFISGEQKYIGDAIKVFNQAIQNKNFQKGLLVRLKAAQETLTDASRALGNKDEVKMALDRAEEIGKIIETLKN
jgi:RHS repeat-associated protein